MKCYFSSRETRGFISMGVLSFTRYNQNDVSNSMPNLQNLLSLNHTDTFRFPSGKILNCDFKGEKRIGLQFFCILQSFEIYCAHLLSVCQ